jgi:hypothetical protein
MLKSDLRVVESPVPNDGAGGKDGQKRQLDVQAEDIQQLLNSLHSTEFVGTIDPKYHSRYLSTPSF